MDRWLGITSHIYQMMVFAYPNDFRHRYAAEMASVFEESCADAYRKGAIALAALYFATVYDLLKSAIAAHTSRFFSNFKSDVGLVSKSPAFAAAFGALAGNLFFIQELVFGPPFGLRKTIQERLILLGIASLNIAILWLASIVFSHLVVHTASRKQCLPLKSRLRAFRRLASIGIVVALGTAAKLVISERVFSMDLRTAAVPAVSYWIAFPVMLLAILLIIFLIQPVLELRTFGKDDFSSMERGS